MIITGILILLIFVFYLVLSKNAETPLEAWDEFIENSDGVLKYLGKAAKPLGGSQLIRKSTQSTYQYRALTKKLELGGAFYGMLEIYLAIQVFALIIGSLLLVIASFALTSGIAKITIGLLAGVVIVYPYNFLASKASKKAEIINYELPDFVELLVMVLPSMSVPQSLSFTAENFDSLVSAEIRELVKTLATRKVSEEEAFNITARRLGTDDGKQFIDILKDAYLEGTRSVESISSLAENMRKASFQRQRAMLKKLPVKLTILFAIHFMPMLMALTFLPVIYSLAGVSK